MNHIIRNIQFSYIDKKLGIGPFIDFIDEMVVPSLEYEDIVSTLLKDHPECEDIKVISFLK